jgi:aminoglycoside 3-N-acetyltransferase
MISFREIDCGLRNLGLEKDKPLIIHASLSAFGEIRGGVDTLLGALLANFRAIMMPTFTYKTMIVPETGPEKNGIIYGSGKDRNQMAIPFDEAMPADKLMGVLAEAVRKAPTAERSSHPILSFAGIGVETALDAQTLADPLAPIGVLSRQDAWVLLLGVDHTVNTSIHYAEKQAGRKQFVRWALGPKQITECPGFPGCSNGFNQIEPILNGITVRTGIGNAEVQAIPLAPMLQIAADMVEDDHQALLCNNPECERCNVARANGNGA